MNEQHRSTEYRVPRHIQSECENWARYELHDGDSPIPAPFKEASWVRYTKADKTEWEIDPGAPEEVPPPIHYPSARRVHAFFKCQGPVLRHVMCSEFVGNYIYGRPRGRQETVRLLNTLVELGKLEVPTGFAFRLHQYEFDLQYLVRRMEADIEIRS